MLKALLKKQFLELNTYYFRNHKTGKNRGTRGTIMFIALFALLFISLGTMFFGVGEMIGGPLITAGCGWLYFSVMGLIALALGVFGSVFNTYAGLFHAKDNELLLAMPIPPSRILLVRLMGVYAMGLLYEAMVMVPTVIVWWRAAASVSAPTVILQLLLILLLGLVILVLTCALGWVVALIAGRLRGKYKGFITVALSLVFIVVYYVVYFRINTFLQGLLADVEHISGVIRGGLYPVYVFGRAGEGVPGAWLAFAVTALALSALCWLVMSRSFIRIATSNRGEKKTVYKERAVKTEGVRSALLRKELRRFKSSPTYMLNCGLGIVLMPVAAVLALAKADMVRTVLDSLTAAEPMMAESVPLLITTAVGILSAMNMMTAPSVSLEGKNLWLLRSLPVDPWEILRAKLDMHMLLSSAPALLSSVILGVVFRLEGMQIFYTAVTALLFVQFGALLGLTLNLKKPNLQWTNEAAVVKQSLAVLLTMFGLWAVAAAMSALYFLLRNVLPVNTYILLWIVLLALVCRLLNAWLRQRGTEILTELS